MTIPPLDDLGQLADMALAECSRRDVRYVCPYCTHEVADERTACCGEVHAEPISEGYDE